MSEENEKGGGYAPFPEIVDKRRGAWSVEHNASGQAFTGKRERLLSTPTDRSGIGASRHELAHVRFSPVAVGGIDFDPRAIQVVEDAKLNLWLQRTGLPMDGADLPDSSVLNEAIGQCFADDIRRGDPIAAAYRVIATVGTSSLDIQGPKVETMAWLAADWPEVHGVVSRAVDRMDTLFGAGKVQPFTATKREAQRLAEELEAALDRESERQGGDGESQSGDGESQSGDGESQSGDGESQSGDGESQSGDGESQSGDGESREAAERRKAVREAKHRNFMAKRSKRSGTVDEREVRRRLKSKRALDRLRKDQADEAAFSHAAQFVAPGFEEAHSATYGPMTVVEPALTEVQPVVRSALSRPRTSDEGTIATRMDRYCVDGAVFRRSSRVRRSRC